MESRPIRHFKDLDAWQVAMDLAVACYQVAKQLPADERFELSAQIKRAAVSVPSNIAEGHSCRSDGILRRHLRIALGSLGELETHFELMLRLGYRQPAELKGTMEQLLRTVQLVNGLVRIVRVRQPER